MTEERPEPASRITLETTYLEMLHRPSRATVRAPHEKIAVLHAERPTVSFYRYLYETVGAPWLWWERRRLGDAALRAILLDPDVDVTVLYVGGVPAGYVELDGRLPDRDDPEANDSGPPEGEDLEAPQPATAAAVVGGPSASRRRLGELPWKGRDVELAYFGLVPEFIGRGLGWYFLNWAIDHAWYQGSARLWVHTCNLDHTRALLTYQRAGFQAYRHETQEIEDPRRWMVGSSRTSAVPPLAGKGT